MILQLKCLGCLRHLESLILSVRDAEEAAIDWPDWKALNMYKLVVCQSCSYTTIIDFDFKLRPVTREQVEFLENHDSEHYTRIRAELDKLQRNMWG